MDVLIHREEHQEQKSPHHIDTDSGSGSGHDSSGSGSNAGVKKYLKNVKIDSIHDDSSCSTLESPLPVKQWKGVLLGIAVFLIAWLLVSWLLRSPPGDLASPVEETGVDVAALQAAPYYEQEVNDIHVVIIRTLTEAGQKDKAMQYIKDHLYGDAACEAILALLPYLIDTGEIEIARTGIKKITDWLETNDDTEKRSRFALQLVEKMLKIEAGMEPGTPAQ